MSRTYNTLEQAIDDTALDSVHALLTQRADVNALTSFRKPLLHLAIEKGNHDIITALLDHRADINVANSSKGVLHCAAIRCRRQTLTLLLQRNANVRTNFPGANTPLHIAVEKANLDAIQVLLEHKLAVDVEGYRKSTPLHLAARVGNRQVIDVLIEQRANVHAIDAGRYTPLHEAAITRDCAVMQQLLAHRADINAHDENGKTVLHCLAAISEDTEALQYVLSLDTLSVNATDRFGKAPIHYAHTVAVIRSLLRHRANINATCANGHTALYRVIRGPYKQETALRLAECLLQCRADPNIVCDAHTRYTALHAAALLGSRQLVEKLLQYGADPTLTTVCSSSTRIAFIVTVATHRHTHTADS
jgi:ankyrin repeat protein